MYLRQEEKDPDSWVQVVLKRPTLDLAVTSCSNPIEKDTLIRSHWDSRLSLGRPFVQYLILQYPDGAMDLCIKLDHASYDGTLLRIFDEQFAALRENRPLPQVTPFRAFIEHIHQADTTEMLSFWKAQLAGTSFTARVTPSTIFQTAYSILLIHLSESTNVLYDYLHTGRNVGGIANPQMINGACANFLPIRSDLSNPSMPLITLLRSTQSAFWRITENGLVALADVYGALGVDRKTHGAKTLLLFQPFEPVPASASSPKSAQKDNDSRSQSGP
ncbi:hypothetical protein BDW74DRAFT_182482 [Aspergillus multicolor]|uniref:uncharacterized protein n=1 Tax=Aspergillus multicolor TaxID=41759 RepID=UPI003CCDB812